MRRIFSLIATTATLLAAAACGSDKPTAPPNIEDTTFAPALRVDLAAMTKTASGLYYQDMSVGDGTAAQTGHIVTVHYTGWLANGTEFDASANRGRPFEFTLGFGEVIAGWDEGLRGMQVGGTRKLVIPPALGYGARANGRIPANSILVFDVELVAVR